jgi:3-oxoacyl-[acyl-carrier-protein] synthase III
MVEAIDLIVPHQANRTMVVELAGQAGITEDSLYFNIDRVGNVSAASIPIAIYDAVMDGVITEPVRIFTPGFGAGAVAGYCVMRLDPAVVVPEHTGRMVDEAERDAANIHPTSVEDVRAAFG